MLKFILVKLLTQNYFENVLQALKSEAFARFEFVPVEYCDVKHVKQSFKKLMRACTPSTTSTDTEKGLLGHVHESDWGTRSQKNPGDDRTAPPQKPLCRTG